jgi:hypothetical protein
MDRGLGGFSDGAAFSIGKRLCHKRICNRGGGVIETGCESERHQIHAASRSVDLVRNQSEVGLSAYSSVPTLSGLRASSSALYLWRL